MGSDTNNFATDANNGTPIGITLQKARRAWRYEVLGNGKYWMWRRGSRDKRESMYGGRFDTLPRIRQIEYEQNRELYRERKTAAQARRENGIQRDQLIAVRERIVLHA